MTRTHVPHLRSFSAFALTALIAACSGGGGGGGNGVNARVPDGSGQLAIQMAGTWEIRQAQVIDTNDPNAAAPLNGTPIVLGVQSVQSIGGLSVARTDLETVLGFPLDLYVNQLDGKTILYGVGYDRRAQGGVRQQVGVAAGSLDDNTIAVEQFTSTQTASQQSEVFVRARYQLVRLGVSPQQPADLRLGTEPTGELQALRPLFGR